MTAHIGSDLLEQIGEYMTIEGRSCV